MKERFQKSPVASSRGKQWEELKIKVKSMKPIWIITDKPGLLEANDRIPNRVRCHHMKVGVDKWSSAKSHEKGSKKPSDPKNLTPPNQKKGIDPKKKGPNNQCHNQDQE